MARPLNLNSLPRPERQLYAKCAAPGCNREPRAFSRYCSLHARNYHRTRDPNGRSLRNSELKHYRKLAEEYLTRNANHPAVIAAEEFLRVNLGDSTMPGEIRKQMQRLTRDGIEPRVMLVNFLAVTGLGFYLPHTATSDACWAFNIGNKVLRSSPLPTVKTASGNTYSVRLPARVAEAYGVMLRQALGLFANQFWKHVQNQLEAPYEAARTVNEAVRATPLDSPQKPAEDAT